MNKLKNILDFDIFEFAKHRTVKLENDEIFSFLAMVEIKIREKYKDILSSGTNSYQKWFYFIENRRMVRKRLDVIIEENGVYINWDILDFGRPKYFISVEERMYSEINTYLYYNNEDEYFDKLFSLIDKYIIEYDNSTYEKILDNILLGYKFDHNKKITPYLDLLLNSHDVDKKGPSFYTCENDDINLVIINYYTRIFEFFNNSSQEYSIYIKVIDLKNDKFELMLERSLIHKRKIKKVYLFQSKDYIDTIVQCMKDMLEDMQMEF